MASIKPRKNKDGLITSYTITVFRGRDENGKKLKDWTRSYPDKKKGEKIPSGWSQKRIEKEVQKVATLFEEECLNGNVATRKIKFSEYAKEVLDIAEKTKTMKRSSIAKYELLFKRINDVDLNGIGYMYVSDIRTHHLNKFYTTLIDKAICQSRNKGEPLSPSEIRKYHTFISGIMTRACKEGLITVNPCKNATLPKKDQKEPNVFTEEELPYVIDSFDTLPLQDKTYMYLLLTTGARKGEVLGIKWQDIDFDKNIIHLAQNVQYNSKYGLYIDTLKTGEGRDVSVSKFTIDLLKELKNSKKRISFNDDNFVFTSKNDSAKVCSPSTIATICYTLTTKRAIANKDFSVTDKYGDEIKIKKDEIVKLGDCRNRKKDKIKNNEKVLVIGDYRNQNFVKINKDYIRPMPHINAHKFRHTYTSFLAYSNLDVVLISKSLGHSRVSTTQDYYSHLFKKVDDRPAKLFDEMLSKRAK